MNLDSLKNRQGITDKMLWELPIVQIAMLDLPSNVLSVIIKERFERERSGTAQDTSDILKQENKVMFNFIRFHELLGAFNEYLAAYYADHVRGDPPKLVLADVPGNQ